MIFGGTPKKSDISDTKGLWQAAGKRVEPVVETTRSMTAFLRGSNRQAFKGKLRISGSPLPSSFDLLAHRLFIRRSLGLPIPSNDTLTAANLTNTLLQAFLEAGSYVIVYC